MIKYLALLALLAGCGSPTPKYKNGTCLQSENHYVVEIRFVDEVSKDFEYIVDVIIVDKNTRYRSYLTEKQIELNKFKVVPCPTEAK